MATHEVFLLSSKGSRTPISCSLSESIKDLRRKVCVALDCEDKQLRIIFCGKEIKDLHASLLRIGIGQRECWSVHCSVKPADKKKSVKPQVVVNLPESAVPKRPRMQSAAAAARSAPVVVPPATVVAQASSSSSGIMVDLTSDDEAPTPATASSSASSSQRKRSAEQMSSAGTASSAVAASSAGSSVEVIIID
jgi:hypothetical protein